MSNTRGLVRRARKQGKLQARSWRWIGGRKVWGDPILAEITKRLGELTAATTITSAQASAGFRGISAAFRALREYESAATRWQKMCFDQMAEFPTPRMLLYLKEILGKPIGVGDGLVAKISHVDGGE